MCSFLIF
ncbi:hypothetical protein B4U79_02408 [Dinothrombium tinctorium]|nr:hypothetical protein B4U79_02408 [Dinothrombium tinctorium]